MHPAIVAMDPPSAFNEKSVNGYLVTSGIESQIRCPQFASLYLITKRNRMKSLAYLAWTFQMVLFCHFPNSSADLICFGLRQAENSVHCVCHALPLFVSHDATRCFRVNVAKCHLAMSRSPTLVGVQTTDLSAVWRFLRHCRSVWALVCLRGYRRIDWNFPLGFPCLYFSFSPTSCAIDHTS